MRYIITAILALSFLASCEKAEDSNPYDKEYPLPKMSFGKGKIYNTEATQDLVEAAETGDLMSVKDALERGANIDAAFSPPLMIAIYRDDYELASLLIESGADVNYLFFKTLPLTAAIEKGNVRMVELLLKAGANPCDRSYMDSSGVTSFSAIKLAIKKENLEIVRLLLESRDEEGKTLLHNTVIGNNKELSALLVDMGADINALSRSGKTALDIARTEEMRDLLFSRGAVSGEDLKKSKNK
jgi:ankyrin repeat protein